MNKLFAGKRPGEQFATAEVLLLCSTPLIVLYHTVIDVLALLMR